MSKKIPSKICIKITTRSIDENTIKRNDVGILPFHLKEEFKSKSDDIDIEGLINTFYINKYNSLLILSLNDLFNFVALCEKVKKTSYYLPNEFDFKTFNKVRMKLPNEFQQEITPYENQVIDFVAVFKSNLEIQEIYNNYFSNLNENGMIAICLKYYKNKDILNLINILKNQNINHKFLILVINF
ncbi:hypothetical protein NW731_02950 [Mycoplasmopsis felis]|uniref:BC85_0335 family putative methyltransferase n=1 Tax=Mycoplasmopsis felis TaxID=33923 RepID=UPI0021E06D0A|nr:hypothetical protein [Mycoplasmopsis felis]MCU9937424.1 hypothetical protein [Mycoplasmopsis felis]